MIGAGIALSAHRPRRPTMIETVSESPIDAGRIRRIAGLTYRAAEAYIALGQRLVNSGGRSQPPSHVIAELDQVAEHLLGLATHLARLATALEQPSSSSKRRPVHPRQHGEKRRTGRAGRSADPES